MNQFQMGMEPCAEVRSRSASSISRAASAAGRPWAVALSAWLVMALLVTLAAGQASADTTDARIDLNRATADELATLPGIGASKAASIVDYREATGAFKEVGDLESVRGIGPALVTKLRPLVTLGAPGHSRTAPKSAMPGKSGKTPAKAARSSKK